VNALVDRLAVYCPWWPGLHGGNAQDADAKMTMAIMISMRVNPSVVMADVQFSNRLFFRHGYLQRISFGNQYQW
jgi:hypothetical protein